MAVSMEMVMIDGVRMVVMALVTVVVMVVTPVIMAYGECPAV